MVERSCRLAQTRSALIIISMLLIIAVVMGCSGLQPNGETKTVVVGPPVEQGDANSNEPAISADGRSIAFTSNATNLLTATTLNRNIFLKEVDTGVTTLVSAKADGSEGNGDSAQPAISADGRYVVFSSSASDLVDADTNDFCVNAAGANINCTDIFLRDTETGELTIISTDAVGNQGDGISLQPAISADGRLVAFDSYATNLIPGDGNGESDIFLKDTASGNLLLVSAGPDGVPGNGKSAQPSISADGRYVAFQSQANDLVAGDTNGEADVFLKDTVTGAITLVSSDASGASGNQASGIEALAISADGRFVIFESGADNLVEGDLNEMHDIFLKDTQTGAIALVSSDAAGGQGDEHSVQSVAVAADGATAFFSSRANNLVPDDTMTKSDIFRKIIQTGAVDMLSTDAAGASGNGASERLAATPDGTFVAFSSDATNLVPDDTNGMTDIFLKNLDTGEIVIISTSTA